MLTAEINRTRKLGTEFEMTVPLVGTGNGHDVQTTLARVLSANGIRAIARPYDHSPLPAGTDVAVEFDSSVHGETRFQGITWYPVEIKTRILNGCDDWERIVPSMLDICKYMGARVNTSCGHHVHVGLEEATADARIIRSLYAIVHRMEPVIYGLVAPSRQTCGYARPMLPTQACLLRECRRHSDLAHIIRDWNRYFGLNLCHVLDEMPRVEFRYHHGTLDATKARNWLRFLLRLTDHATTRSCHSFDEQLTADRRGIERAMISLGLKVNSRIYSKVSPELRETGKFILARWKSFNGAQRLVPQSHAATAIESEAA